MIEAFKIPMLGLDSEAYSDFGVALDETKQAQPYKVSRPAGKKQGRKGHKTENEWSVVQQTGRQ